MLTKEPRWLAYRVASLCDVRSPEWRWPVVILALGVAPASQREVAAAGSTLERNKRQAGAKLRSCLATRGLSPFVSEIFPSGVCLAACLSSACQLACTAVPSKQDSGNKISAFPKGETAQHKKRTCSTGVLVPYDVPLCPGGSVASGVFRRCTSPFLLYVWRQRHATFFRFRASRGPCFISSIPVSRFVSSLRVVPAGSRSLASLSNRSL